MKLLKKKEFGVLIAVFIVLALAISAEAVFSDAGQLSSSSASTTDSFNFSPDDLFQKLKDFISIEVSILIQKQ